MTESRTIEQRVHRWMDYGISGVMPPVEVVKASDYDKAASALKEALAALRRVLPQARGALVVQDIESAIESCERVVC